MYKFKLQVSILFLHYVYDDLDPLMLIELNKWKPNVTSRSNVTIGRTTVELINKCHDIECNIGNLITDSFVYYVSYYFNLKYRFTN